ncbi:hypothetical protein LX32DRAFT_637500 [Colletotrichum zoysiae]|uniref:Uncharacterized protein n=1 Tax=Colletotrichum zoysiae TaxID=1216348 RepID=A0AAD9M6Y0_9PEZI|nr:hypothetical protein LX32DRAFT_637500 [Colletotrichum zoysiae]
MPTSARRGQPPRQAKSLPVGRNDDGFPPQPSSDDGPSGNRRSKRLGHVEIDDVRDFEALTRKRRRTREHEDRSDEGEDAVDSTTTALSTGPKAKGRDRRHVRTNLRVDTLRKAANSTRHMNNRSSKVAKAPRSPDHISRVTRSTGLARNTDEGRPPRIVMLGNAEHAAETEPVGDVYEFRASSPSKPRSQEVTSARTQSRRVYTPEELEAGNGLFVQQEVDDADENDGYGSEGEESGEESGGEENGGDEQLYDDPTIVGLPPSAQTRRATEDAAHGAGPQYSAATEQLQRLVIDMGPAPPEPSDEGEEEYPDDHFIFNKPTRQDRVATAPVKSYFLKSIKELMGGNGWTKSRKRTPLVTNLVQLSKRTRPLWNELCHLGEFWEGIPRAPLYDQQWDYLHSDDQDATSARQTIKKVDSLVSAVADKAKEPSRGEESDMPPPRFVVDLYERIIPFLVEILEIVFRKGAETERSRYTGRFTKTLLQIMQRVVAWIERLYEAMQSSLARRRPMEQSLSKRTSRGRLGEYLRGFKSELGQTWEKTDEMIERQQLYEEKLLLSRAKKEREQREWEDARRRQRELCDMRLQERLRQRSVQMAQIEASSSQYSSQTAPSSQPQSSQRTSRGAQRAAPARTGPGDRAETAAVGPSKPWPEDDAKKLLGILTTRPWMEMEALAWELERSEEDVQAMVELLKRSARTYATSRGKTVPAFAAN